MRSPIFPLLATVLLAAVSSAFAAPPVEWKITGDWEIEIDRPAKAVVKVEPAAWLTVSAQKYDTLPPYQTTGGGWKRGVQLTPLKAQETTTPFLLDPDSFVLRAGPEESAAVFVRGQDYEIEPTWGTLGRLPDGSIREGQPVYASYRHGLLRLDSVVLTAEGKIAYRFGEPRAAAPLPPDLQEGETRLGNIWLPGAVKRLTPDHLFPILEEAYPEAPKSSPTVAERLVPKALAKLRSGEPIRILAWGDSVTVGDYLPDYPKSRWQDQFVARLQERFPKATIELVTEAWGGRNTGSYLAEPPGSEHNYEEKVLAAKPDLIVSEFVNDAGLKPEQVEERYGKLLADFQRIGAEWIILTPHYTRPDWMGLDRERDIDEDPRPYVKGLREFSTKHGVALADASLRYGRLWRQGLPHSTLMLNSINHPDARGMKLFADALMELFP
ncbi:MAG TPA: SGNH/GDSL hydrolase family protein [Bacteroidia bacterium]|nr:SGNH/GDSL hydrolase family protein [Bacteroidia bacterium]